MKLNKAKQILQRDLKKITDCVLNDTEYNSNLPKIKPWELLLLYRWLLPRLIPLQVDFTKLVTIISRIFQDQLSKNDMKIHKEENQANILDKDSIILSVGKGKRIIVGYWKKPNIIFDDINNDSNNTCTITNIIVGDLPDLTNKSFINNLIQNIDARKIKYASINGNLLTNLQAKYEHLNSISSFFNNRTFIGRRRNAVKNVKQKGKVKINAKSIRSA